jgi:hypothetical protein
MEPRESNERSPLRVLEQSIRGGLGRGNIGVVVARHGVGKTAFLVGVALDDLLRGRKVLHVSLEQPVERVLVHYDEIFADLVRERALEDPWKVRLGIERNRRIHSYLGGSFSTEKLRQALAFKKEHSGFAPAAILIEGFEFEKASSAELADLREIADECQAELWMSAVTHRESETDPRGVPEPVARFAESIDVILKMAHDGKVVRIGLLKDHDNPNVSELRLALDPTTMLLVGE